MRSRITQKPRGKVVTAAKALERPRHSGKKSGRIRFPGRSGKVGRPRHAPDLLGAF